MRASRAAFLALLALARRAEASAPNTFGASPESAALALSDVARPGALGASVNPSSAASPGLRLGLGYGRSSMRLAIDGRDPGLRPVAGTTLSVQAGVRAGEETTLGLSLSAYLPDAGLAQIVFRRASEPQFPLYEASLARAAIDTVAAIRRGRFAVGGGLSWSADLGGSGTRFLLGQDANGTYADAQTDVDLRYRVAPLAGASASFGPLSIGAAFRGAIAADLHLESVNTVSLTDNPLNGDTTVRIQGSSGYDPARLDLGVEVSLPRRVFLLGAMELSFYSAAPPPVADVAIEVDLGTSPGLREATFVLPRFRDTLSPRIGVELDGPPLDPRSPARRGEGKWALLAGYLFSPSPVPAQTGFTSYADPPRHVVAAGGKLALGRFAGVDVSTAAAASLHVLPARDEEKPDPALPFSRFSSSGHILYGALSAAAAWR